MKQYKSLDVAKFIAAVLIIILHTAPFSSYSKILTFGIRNIATVVAVPFFFVTSGFLFFKKYDALPADKQKQYIRQYLKRLLVIYCIWSAVYFVFVVERWLRKGFTVYCVLEYIRDFLFEGSYSTIWFLPALLSAVFIVTALHRKLSCRVIFFISGFVYLFTLGGSSYYGLAMQVPLLETIYDAYYTFFDSIKNGLCFGMIFVSLGACLASEEENKHPGVGTFIALALCACLLAVEEFLVAWLDWNMRGVDTVIMLVPFSYFLMKCLLRLELNVTAETCKVLRTLSILMFLCQRIPMTLIDLFLTNTLIKQNSLLYFTAVFSSTLLLSLVIMKASEKHRLLRMAF